MTAQLGLSLLGWAASTWAPAPPTLSSLPVVLLGETGCSCPCLSPGGQPGKPLCPRPLTSALPAPAGSGTQGFLQALGHRRPGSLMQLVPLHRVRVTPHGSRFEGRRRVALYGWAGAMWGCFQSEVSNLKSPEHGLPGVEGWGWMDSQPRV